MILAGDVGGTKTILALFDVQAGKPVRIVQEKFSSKDHAGLEAIITEFRARHKEQVTGSCFGVAGPVVKGTVKTPNLPWLIETSTLAKDLGTDRIWLLNDLEATAYGVLTLDDHDLCVLNSGVPSNHDNLGLIAAGTGLGESIIYWDGKRYQALASEGGHADFAPRSSLEIALLSYLIERFGHVSYERVVSGPGLLNIYHFLKDRGYGEEPSWLGARLAADDPSAAISETALAQEAEICVQALDMFVAVYGAEAGNLALRGKTLGGVYIGGGIAPKIISKLKDGSFMAAFADKGRYRDFLRSIPVRVVLNEEAGLLGAAAYAARQSSSAGSEST